MFTGLGKKNAMLETGCPRVGRTRPVASRRLHGTSIRRSRERVIWLSGFTLLEITLAVAILAMMSLAIFRFVQSNLTALRVSADASAADAQYGGLRDLLAAEWQSLTPITVEIKRPPARRDKVELQRWPRAAYSVRARRLYCLAAIATGKRKERPIGSRSASKTAE